MVYFFYCVLFRPIAISLDDLLNIFVLANVTYEIDGGVFSRVEASFTAFLDVLVLLK